MTSNARISIVEDENIIVVDLKQRLGSLGYQVVGMVATGKETIAKTAETCPDLVLRDILLKARYMASKPPDTFANNGYPGGLFDGPHSFPAPRQTQQLIPTLVWQREHFQLYLRLLLVVEQVGENEQWHSNKHGSQLYHTQSIIPMARRLLPGHERASRPAGRGAG